MQSNLKTFRPIKMGMIGGGQGAFIGAIHRMAAALDGEISLVAGSFSSSIDNTKATGAALGLADDRLHASWQVMLEREAARSSLDRIDLISIVTPNDLHLPVAKKSLEFGFHVVSDKPATRNLEEALILKNAVDASPGIYALTHTYLGYPMIKEARARVLRGDIGPVRKVVVHYLQGWLASALESTGQKQAIWRTDPALSGPSGCLGDIGTHATTLVEYILDDQIKEVCADLATVVPGRALDDDGSIIFRTHRGARGTLTASQVCNGEENDLSIRIYGVQGSFEWRHRNPNTLICKNEQMPTQQLRAGSNNDYLSPAALRHCRTPAGHPEGYIEAFANIYRNVARAISARKNNVDPNPIEDFPGIDEGVSGLAFIDAALRNMTANEKWTPLDGANKEGI